MEFGIFYEHQLPKPWKECPEHPEIVAALDPPSRASVTGAPGELQILRLLSLKPQALRIV